MKVHENAEHCRTLWQKTGKKNMLRDFVKERFLRFLSGSKIGNRSFYVHPKRASNGQVSLHKLCRWGRVSALPLTHNSLSSGMHRPTRWLRNSHHPILYHCCPKSNRGSSSQSPRFELLKRRYTPIQIVHLLGTIGKFFQIFLFERSLLS